ncbi:conserved protein of unknown function [Paraburkholderia kururiensis]|uniref:hypothetical protein n=1 Tax=Paraburkholderia kururiensis TaxID=984307 RepID=UPI0039A6DB72
MDAASLETTSPGVRTVLHLSPAVMVAALLSAQKNGMNLREWLDRAVADRIADDHPEGAAPWSVQSADFFAHVANVAPELLHGRWSLLFERVLLERSLWHETTLTVGEIEDGEPLTEPFIVPARLRKAWPRLVAEVFCL